MILLPDRSSILLDNLLIPHYSIDSSMRTYAPYDRTKQGSQVGKKKERRERSSEEWDIRIDCDATYADVIVNNLRNCQYLLDYALVSGIEKADSETLNYGSKNNHIHIALVFLYPMRAYQAMQHCRGLLPLTGEYCVPRNKKFTYAGWFMHHTKIDWKLANERPIRYEYGLLPADEMDDDTKKKVKSMYNKFGKGSEEWEAENKSRFLAYL
uniref:Replication-associated protein n=1 Tax=Prunella montanella CRESS-DNA-virus sp. TaxID=2815056 RepID=A0A8A4XC71_9VIRU|nr:MAG: replication-associated protein [Prunella montanella CRESS-DNA-virus sp.]